MWVKPGQLEVGLCGLHHKNKTIVKKTDGGNVLGSSSGWAEKHLCQNYKTTWLVGSSYHSSHQAYRNMLLRGLSSKTC